MREVGRGREKVGLTVCTGPEVRQQGTKEKQPGQVGNSDCQLRAVKHQEPVLAVHHRITLFNSRKILILYYNRELTRLNTA